MSHDNVPANFRWLVEGRIAASGLPERPEHADALDAAGVRAVVSFHPLPEEVRERLRERAIEHLPFLVRDFVTPQPQPLQAFFDFLERRVYPAEGPSRPVLLH